MVPKLLEHLNIAYVSLRATVAAASISSTPCLGIHTFCIHIKLTSASSPHGSACHTERSRSHR
jgi:hypothetical protein